jgi:hypothetical protein
VLQVTSRQLSQRNKLRDHGRHVTAEWFQKGIDNATVRHLLGHDCVEDIRVADSLDPTNSAFRFEAAHH